MRILDPPMHGFDNIYQQSGHIELRRHRAETCQGSSKKTANNSRIWIKKGWKFSFLNFKNRGYIYTCPGHIIVMGYFENGVQMPQFEIKNKPRDSHKEQVRTFHNILEIIHKR